MSKILECQKLCDHEVSGWTDLRQGQRGEQRQNASLLLLASKCFWSWLLSVFTTDDGNQSTTFIGGSPADLWDAKIKHLASTNIEYAQRGILYTIAFSDRLLTFSVCLAPPGILYVANSNLPCSKNIWIIWPHERPQQKPSCGRISTSGGFCASAIARVQTTLLSCRITGLEKLCSNYTTSSRMLCNLIVKNEIILKFCQKLSVFVSDGCALECHRPCLCKSAGGVWGGLSGKLTFWNHL